MDIFILITDLNFKKVKKTINYTTNETIFFENVNTFDYARK